MSQDLVVAKARWWAKYPKQAGAEIGDAFSRFQKVMTELYGSHVWVLGAGGRSEVSPDEFRRRWTSEVFPTGNPDDQSLIAVWERFTLTLELVQMGGQFPFDLETISSLLSALRHGGACFDDDENMPSLESGELNCLHNKMVGQIIKLQRWADVQPSNALSPQCTIAEWLKAFKDAKAFFGEQRKFETHLKQLGEKGIAHKPKGTRMASWSIELWYLKEKNIKVP